MNETIPRQNAMVRFDLGNLDPSWWKKYPFEPEGIYIFLGESPNMPGHCIVVEYKSGQIYSGYHTENFIEIPDDET